MNNPFNDYEEPVPGERKKRREKEAKIKIAIALGVIGVIMATVAFQYGSTVLTDEPPETVEEDDGEAQMLPQMTRIEGDYTDIRDPFAEPGELKGIIAGGGGADMAIIETARGTYVASQGELIDDYWKLREIHRDKVVLEAQGERVILGFDEDDDPRVTDDPFDPEEEVEEPDEEEEETDRDEYPEDPDEQEEEGSNEEEPDEEEEED